jgi:hypothetical protein
VDGGIKALVKQIRAAKRAAAGTAPKEPPRKITQTIEKLRIANPMAIIADDPAGGETGEFILLVARRDAPGTLAVLARAESDDALLQRAIKGVCLPE